MAISTEIEAGLIFLPSPQFCGISHKIELQRSMVDCHVHISFPFEKKKIQDIFGLF